MRGVGGVAQRPGSEKKVGHSLEGDKACRDEKGWSSALRHCSRGPREP